MLIRNGRNPRASTVSRIAPAVVGADDPVPLDPAWRERGSPVDAQVVESLDLAPQPANDHPLIQELDGNRPVVQVFDKGDRVPVFSKHRPKRAFLHRDVSWFGPNHGGFTLSRISLHQLV